MLLTNEQLKQKLADNDIPFRKKINKKQLVDLLLDFKEKSDENKIGLLKIFICK